MYPLMRFDFDFLENLCYVATDLCNIFVYGQLWRFDNVAEDPL